MCVKTPKGPPHAPFERMSPVQGRPRGRVALRPARAGRARPQDLLRGGFRFLAEIAQQPGRRARGVAGRAFCPAGTGAPQNVDY